MYVFRTWIKAFALGTACRHVARKTQCPVRCVWRVLDRVYMYSPRYLLGDYRFECHPWPFLCQMLLSQSLVSLLSNTVMYVMGLYTLIRISCVQCFIVWIPPWHFLCPMFLSLPQSLVSLLSNTVMYVMGLYTLIRISCVQCFIVWIPPWHFLCPMFLSLPQSLVSLLSNTVMYAMGLYTLIRISCVQCFGFRTL